MSFSENAPNMTPQKKEETEDLKNEQESQGDKENQESLEELNKEIEILREKKHNIETALLAAKRRYALDQGKPERGITLSLAGTIDAIRDAGIEVNDFTNEYFNITNQLEAQLSEVTNNLEQKLLKTPEGRNELTEKYAKSFGMSTEEGFKNVYRGSFTRNIEGTGEKYYIANDLSEYERSARQVVELSNKFDPELAQSIFDKKIQENVPEKFRSTFEMVVKEAIPLVEQQEKMWELEKTFNLSPGEIEKKTDRLARLDYKVENLVRAHARFFPESSYTVFKKDGKTYFVPQSVQEKRAEQQRSYNNLEIKYKFHEDKKKELENNKPLLWGKDKWQQDLDKENKILENLKPKLRELLQSASLFSYTNSLIDLKDIVYADVPEELQEALNQLAEKNGNTFSVNEVFDSMKEKYIAEKQENIQYKPYKELDKKTKTLRETLKNKFTI
jgi:hypothetical protein